MEPIIMVGASFNAGVVIDILKCGELFDPIGFLDDGAEVGTLKRGYKVLGPISAARDICERWRCKNIALTVGDNWQRRRILRQILERHNPSGYSFPTIKHPSALVADTACVGQGTLLMARAHVGNASRIGTFCMINSGSSLDHDCIMGDFSSFAPGVFTGGQVEVGECSHLGVGVSVSHQKKIGAHAVIGTGGVVVRDIPALSVSYGNPARVKRNRIEGERYL